MREDFEIVYISGWAMSEAIFAQLSSKILEKCGAAVRFLSVSEISKVALSSRAENLSEVLNIILSDSKKNKIVCAHSLGGSLALECALKFKNSIAALILISSAPCYFPIGSYDPQISYAQINNMLSRLTVSRAEVLEKFFKAALFPTRDGISEHVNYALQLELEVLEYSLRYLREINLIDLLPKLTCPFLLFHGAKDLIIAPQVLPFLWSSLSSSRFSTLSTIKTAPILIDGAGHLLVKSDALLIAPSVIEFIKTIVSNFDEKQRFYN